MPTRKIGTPGHRAFAGAVLIGVALLGGCTTTPSGSPLPPGAQAEVAMSTLDPGYVLRTYGARTAHPRAQAKVVRELAPSGRLRVAINFGNPLLARRGVNGGDPLGVSVDIARELARHLDVPAELLRFDAAGKVVEAMAAGQLDLAFYAVDPARATDSAFSAPYLIIEGAYLVPAASPIQRNEEVDRPGARIVVGRGSAYDLHLSRSLRNATLVRAPTSPEVTALLKSGGFDVAAGVRQQLLADAKGDASLRLLPGRFMEIRQAVAIPKGRADGLGYLRTFVEELKTSGFIQESLRRHNIDGALVAPPS